MLKRIYTLTLIMLFACLIPISASAESISNADIELITRAVATSYPDAEFGANVGICALILNRTRSTGYPDTVAGVISANDSGFNADILASSADEKALRIAKDACLAALSGNDPTGGMLNFERLPQPTRKDNLHDFARSVDLSKYKVVIGGIGFY